MKDFYIKMGILALFSSLSLTRTAGATETRLETNVTNFCKTEAFNSVSSENLQTIAQPSGIVVVFNNFVDQQTLIPLAFDAKFTIEATCNYHNSLSLISQNGGFKSDNNIIADNGFGNRRDYNFSVIWGPNNIQYNTSGTENQGIIIISQGAIKGEVSLQISGTQGAVPLVSGNYTDTLTLILTNTP